MLKQMYVSFIVCLLLAASGLTAQNVDSLLTSWRAVSPQEKIYIHFDKYYYNPGETIWYKAYIFSGLEPSVYSRNFYAELIDETGSVLNRKTSPVVESSSAGSFDLAPNLTKSTLFFRAYTVSMLNGDTAFLYVKPLRIIVPVRGSAAKGGGAAPGTAASPAAAAAQNNTTLRLLPEGGELIAGLAGIVAFKAADQNGLPVAVKGYIKTSDGRKPVDFASVHDGMGSFTLLPEAGQTYTAVWTAAGGREQSTPLPAVKPTGVALQVQDGENGKKFMIQRTDNVPDEDKQLHIMAFMNQHLIYSAKANLLDKSATSGMLPTKQLPSGILQVTVFDKNYTPLAERVTFINNHDYEFDADAWIPVTNTAKRGLNKGEVMISDSLAANLSLSVTDADLNVPSPYEDNIISRLLLNGDLRGKIPNAYYYFFNTTDSAGIYLDLVMLTHGWRRYDWSSLLAGKLPPAPKKESNFLSVEGHLMGIDPGKLSPGTTLNGILQTKDSNSMFLVLPVDRKGIASTDGLVFYDDAKLFFQFSDKKRAFDKSSLQVTNGLQRNPQQVVFNEDDKKNLTATDTAVFARNLKNSTDAVKIAAERKRKEQVLQEVVVKGRTKSNEEKLDQKYASGLFSGGDSRNFDVANDPFAAGSFSVFQYLQGKVAGLQINMSGGEAQLSWRGGKPVFYLDEMPADAQMMQTVNMSDVAYIKVFSPSSANAFSSAGGGAIAVYTKKGGDATNSNSKGLDFIQVAGYSPYKQFLSPDYATTQPYSELPDVRITLFWNPYIFLNKTNRRFRYQFYNNDVTRRFRVVLEGFNEEGRLVHIEKVVEQK